MQVEATLNDRVAHGLRAQFNPDRVNAVLTQAETMFHEAQRRSGISIEVTPETYELFEGGWIDRALEFLGFGRWAIGRPKLSHQEPVKRHSQYVSAAQRQSQFAAHNVSVLSAAEDVFLRHIPFPNELRNPVYGFQNAIEYRNILVVGDQGSGKSSIDQELAYQFGVRYSGLPRVFATQTAALIDCCTLQGNTRRAHISLCVRTRH